MLLEHEMWVDFLRFRLTSGIGRAFFGLGHTKAWKAGRQCTELGQGRRSRGGISGVADWMEKAQDGSGQTRVTPSTPSLSMRVEASATRVEAITSRMEAMASMGPGWARTRQIFGMRWNGCVFQLEHRDDCRGKVPNMFYPTKTRCISGPNCGRHVWEILGRSGKYRRA